MLGVLAVLSQGKASAPSGAQSPQSSSQGNTVQKNATPNGASPQSVKSGDAATASTDASGAATSAAKSRTSSVENVNEKNLTFGTSGRTTAQPQTGPSVATFGIWDLVRMVLILGFVVGLIYGVFFLLKRSAAGGRVQESTSMRVLGNLQLPGNRTIHLVEAGRQVFLVGGGEHGITLISEITDQESLDDIRLKYQTAAPGRRRSFSDLLAGMLSGVGLTHRSSGSGSSTASHASDATSDRAPRPGTSDGDGSADLAERWSQIDDGPPGTSHDPVDFLRQQRDRLKRLQE